MSSGINLVKEYIAEHPDWQKCTPALSSFLADAFVTDEVLKHALTESVKLGIPYNIYGCKSLDPNKVKALATYLEETRGVSFKSACRAIVTWGLILDKCSTSQTDYLLQQSAEPPNFSTTPIAPPPPSQPAQPQPTNSGSTNTASPPATPTAPSLSLFAKVCRGIGGLILCVINGIATFGLGEEAFAHRFMFSASYPALHIGMGIYALAIFPCHVFLWMLKTNPASSPPSFLNVTWRAFCAMLTMVCIFSFGHIFLRSDTVIVLVVVVAFGFNVFQYLVLRWLSPKAA